MSMDELRSLLRVVAREECSIEEITSSLVDPRSRRMAQAVGKLEKRLNYFKSLIDPKVQGPIPENITWSYWARKYKNYLSMVWEDLSKAAGRVTVSIGEIVMIVFETNPVIEEATDFSQNLGKQYRIVMARMEELNNVISQVESTVFVDEMVHALFQMRKTRIDIEMMIANQFIEPLKAVLKEEARANVLRRLGQALYGRV